MAGYGIIGFGRIGQRIATRLHGPDAPRLTAVLVRPEQAPAARAVCGEPSVCLEFDEFLARAPDVAVECASAAALAAHGPGLLADGIDLVPLSLTAFADPDVERRLRAASLAGPGRIELAAGAMATIDFLATAREGTLRRVVFRAAYPPARWLGTTAESMIDLVRLDGRETFFRGTARQAARLFPRNLNVCVGVALAGLGLDETEVELLADTSLRQACFEVEAMAAAGPILLRVGPRDAPAGADPVDHTTFSVMAVLRRRQARIAI